MPPLLESGASDEAKVILRKWTDSREFLHRSQAIGSGRIIAEDLAEILEDCAQPDWDGYGAQPVTYETYEQAKQFILALPLGTPSPSLGATPEGSISFDWHRNRRQSLTAIIDADGVIYFAALLGPDHTHGKAQFFGKIPSDILQLIGRTSPC